MIEYKAWLGELLSHAYRESIILAVKENDIVHFSGNGIDFYADKDSNPSLVEIYLNKCYRYDIKSIGPKEPEWTEEFIEQKEADYHDYMCRKNKIYEQIEEEEERDYQEFLVFVKDEEIDVNKPSQLEELRNANSDHIYSRTYVAYLEDIAKYLQVVKRTRGTITREDVVTGERLIRKHGITGFQHACIVNVLKQIWKHWKEGLF